MQQIRNKILVTGGAGYIGSHTIVSLIESGYDVVVLDNFSNSNIESLLRVEKITGVPINYITADVRDKDAITALFSEHAFYGVVHFAGLKAVGESVQEPLRYYQNNVSGALNLLNRIWRP